MANLSFGTLNLFHPVLIAQYSRDHHAGDIITDGIEYF